MRFFLISVCFFVCSINAAISTEQAVEHCRAEQDTLKRLLCYDTIDIDAITVVAKVQADVETPAVELATATTNTNKNANNDFGLEHKNRNQQADDLIYVTVKSISYNQHKELQVEFENGQQWRQQGNDYYPIAIGERHNIKRGALNSFRLGNDKKKRTIKIRREQ